jgi:hypothetical protein
MSRNGSGTYTLPAGNPVVTGTTIASTWANTTLSDIASALTDSIAADGQTTMTGQLDLGNNKIINLANGTNSTDATTLGQVTTQIAAALATVTGKIVQTVASTTTSSFTTTSTSFVSTGHTATITPTSTSSKILCLVTSQLAQTNTNLNTQMTLFRDSTNLAGSGNSFCDVLSSAGNIYANAAISYLDSPSSTSALTYSTRILVDSGTGAYNAGGGGVTAGRASIVLLEIL